MKLYVYLEKIKPMRTPLLLCFGLCALISLSYFLLHNPHQDLHKDLFATAGKIVNYYRDRPGFWQLSTNTAKEDKLIVGSLAAYKDYDMRIGQGLDGETSLPSDLSFNIVLKHLNKSACISLSELPINEDNRLILQKITLINDSVMAEYAWGAENPLPIARYSMRQQCQPTENTLIWTFQ